MSLRLKQRNDGFLVELQRRQNYDLNGAINGINLVFTTTPFKFVNVTGDSILVFLNGQRLYETEDYTLSESGGVGTGYDTVTLAIPPRVNDRVTAEFTLS